MCVRACVTLVPPLVPQALLGPSLPFLTLSPHPWCWLTCAAPPPLPRRAHLKECFETLKRNIPNVDDKKTSNLSVLRTALRYIQVWGREAPPRRGRQRQLPPHSPCPPPLFAAPPALAPLAAPPASTRALSTWPGRLTSAGLPTREGTRGRLRRKGGGTPFFSPAIPFPRRTAPRSPVI